MKEMRGQADAAKVKALILSRLAPAENDGNG
jgi:Asp-tRNA(Asn)/Glu-tRNA(Gln) amidotransferase B subunit